MKPQKEKAPTAAAERAPSSGSSVPPARTEVTACYRSQVVLVKRTGNQIEAHRAQCKCWDCPYCFKRNSARLKKNAYSGRPNKFITLTVNPRWGPDPHFRARQLVDAWRVCRRAIKRRWNGHKVEFLAVFEKTSRGEPHLHILARMNYVQQRWLSNFMLHRIMAPVVDIRMVKSRKQAAAYIAKYISKCPQRFDGTKRHWRSLDYLPRLEPSGSSAKQERARVRPFFAQFERLKASLARWSAIISETESFIHALLPPRLAAILDASFNTS